MSDVSHEPLVYLNYVYRYSFLSQRLIFLIRDWAYPSDYQYGEMGGNAYLREIMQVGITST